MSSSASIVHLHTVADFDRVKRDAGDRLIITDFHASWCPPCKAIAPVYERLATQWRQAIFTKCDVDANQALARQFHVTAMPTFVFYKAGQKLDELRGADPRALQSKLQQHCGPADPSYSSGAGASAGPSASGSSASESSLLGQINKQQSTCLNEAASHTLSKILHGHTSAWLESDADEQLLINLEMQQTLKLRALRLTTEAAKSDQAPKTLRLFINRPTISFDDAESETPAQELTLTPDQSGGKSLIPLRFVAFQRVQSLQIFVKDNQGGADETRIDSLDIVGESGETTADLRGLVQPDE